MTEDRLLELISDVIRRRQYENVVTDTSREILELVRQHDESDGDSEARRSEALERAVAYYQLAGGAQVGGFKALLNTAETFEDWLAGRVTADKVR